MPFATTDSSSRPSGVAVAFSKRTDVAEEDVEHVRSGKEFRRHATSRLHAVLHKAVDTSDHTWHGQYYIKDYDLTGSISADPILSPLLSLLASASRYDYRSLSLFESVSGLLPAYVCISLMPVIFSRKLQLKRQRR